MSRFVIVVVVVSAAALCLSRGSSTLSAFARHHLWNAIPTHTCRCHYCCCCCCCCCGGALVVALLRSNRVGCLQIAILRLWLLPHGDDSGQVRTLQVVETGDDALRLGIDHRIAGQTVKVYLGRQILGRSLRLGLVVVVSTVRLDWGGVQHRSSSSFHWFNIVLDGVQ